MNITARLAEEFHLRPQQVQNTVDLIDQGNTIPFIARYRKEMTGSLDDQLLRELADRLEYLRGLEKRKEEVLASIESQGKLDDSLSQSISAAATLAEVEDLYRPFKPKRRTRAEDLRAEKRLPFAGRNGRAVRLGRKRDRDHRRRFGRRGGYYCGNRVRFRRTAQNPAQLSFDACCFENRGKARSRPCL